MANYSQLKRLISIVYLLKSKQALPKERLLNELYEYYEIEISSRSLERDFQTLRNTFGFEICYEATTNGYTIENEDEQVRQFLSFAKFNALSEIYEHGLSDYQSFQKYVFFEDRGALSGSQHLGKLLGAIVHQQPVSFQKENYYNNTLKTYKVKPLRLKEFQQRWYLIGVPEGISEIRNFGIDRITKLQVYTEHFSVPKAIEQQLANYDHIVGLNYHESIHQDPEKIVLKAHPFQLKYLRSLPIHTSQVCIDAVDDGWGRVEYDLKPNFEFEMQLLKLGAMVEVIAPEWFRQKMKVHIKKLYELYH